MVCHCLLIESARGLVLVDSGLGTADIRAAKPRLPLGFRLIGRPSREAVPAVEQVRRLGFDPRDVRDVVPTHLDLDHAGGFSDFPWATVHVFGREHDAAMRQRSVVERIRYLPVQWSHDVRWHRCAVDGERWFGFDAVRAIDGTVDDVLLVPLVGHTRGHCGVAVRGGSGWILHAGDAYFFHAEMDERPRCSLGLGFFQRLVAMDNAARLRNQGRLRELKRRHAAEVEVMCAHSPEEFDRLSAAL